jgi:signal transduction histidine kinase
VLEVKRLVHSALAGIVGVLAAAEWLRSGGAPAWAAITVVAGVASVGLALARRDRWPGVLAAGGALLVAALVGRAALEIRTIECCWEALREQRVTAASRALDGALDRAVDDARALADRGAAVATLERRAAFAALAAAAGGGRGPERGVVVLGADGVPWAWAGRHRRVPAADTAELRARISPFYVVLEARRQTATGGVAVGSVLLAAMPRPVDPRAALATAFSASRGVDVRITAPAAAPPQGDVFLYEAEGPDTLFAVQLVPPGQGAAKLAALRAAAGAVVAAMVVALLAVLVTAPPGAWRWGVLAAGTWATARAAPAAAPLATLFSPATFFRSVLGDFSASAPVLATTAFLALVLGWHLWQRGVRRSRGGMAAAAVLLLAAPFLIRYLGRGIAPPATGVGLGLWLSWQAAVACTAMALVLWAAALLRGTEQPRRLPRTLPPALAWAVAAAVAGLWLWHPATAWPEWYTYLWLPALAGVVVPAPRRWVLVGVAVVAGSAAALVTWGAALEGRLALAFRDVHRLGGEGDPVAVALLERLGTEARAGPPPASAGELYRFWTESPLAAQDYPAVLGLWDADGQLRAEVRLAPLDLPPALLAALVRGTPDTIGWRVERLPRVPGVHYLLIAPLAAGRRLVVGVGPRTRWLPPHRVARFLRGEPAVEPPYAIALSLPDQSGVEPPRRFWVRDGWSVRGERRLELPGGPRHVHVRVALGPAGTLVVRGALVGFVNLAALAVAWLVARVVAEGWRPRPRPVIAALRGSYRTRLTVALMMFFGVPLLAFALWSFARLGDEARRAGDLLVQQVLRDAALAAGSVALDVPSEAGTRDIVALGRALDADLWVYHGARLSGASAPVLDELGLVDAFLDPVVFGRLALEDELELTVGGRAAGRSLRIGYRVVGAGPPDGQTVLAAPQLLDDERVRRQQQDLALVVILATIAGIAAALVLAARVARELERPVAALRQAADAVGRGRPPPPFPARVPAEFTTVVTAFERMAGDVQRSQAAIEEARERMARVLANVATGVIAVDAGLRVTLANPRATELLGTALAPGDDLPRTAGADWAPVWAAVRAYLAGAPRDIAERDFEVGGRQIRVQIALLGPAPDGCVVALDDTTERSRAARVLAWGEMARQVAHEIKNPLTPIRLGIQHLQRARGGPGDFDRTLTETASRILAEIDRLDAIARAFSRFGAPAADRPPLEPVDLHATAREVVHLYALGPAPGRGGTRVVLEGQGGAPALARRDEVKEVLLNLLENARQAGARTVTVRVEEEGTALVVADDGRGIAPAALPRVFEPAFSTTSSGAGLGLAIARRLVENWGGEIGLSSDLGQGTRVWLRLRAVRGIR